MQTFLPYASVGDSVKCLDYRRLGKQRVETKQILNALDPSYNKRGWRNHPAVLMWKGHEEMLKGYYNACILEWIGRGYNNTMPIYAVNYAKMKVPKWWGGKIHASHRSNLLRKDAVFYGKYGWEEGPDMPYYWPTHHKDMLP